MSLADLNRLRRLAGGGGASAAASAASTPTRLPPFEAMETNAPKALSLPPRAAAAAAAASDRRRAAAAAEAAEPAPTDASAAADVRKRAAAAQAATARALVAAPQRRAAAMADTAGGLGPRGLQQQQQQQQRRPDPGGGALSLQRRRPAPGRRRGGEARRPAAPAGAASVITAEELTEKVTDGLTRFNLSRLRSQYRERSLDDEAAAWREHARALPQHRARVHAGNREPDDRAPPAPPTPAAPPTPEAPVDPADLPPYELEPLVWARLCVDEGHKLDVVEAAVAQLRGGRRILLRALHADNTVEAEAFSAAASWASLRTSVTHDGNDGGGPGANDARLALQCIYGEVRSFAKQDGCPKPDIVRDPRASFFVLDARRRR